jgi:hypothetical protein
MKKKLLFSLITLSTFLGLIYLHFWSSGKKHDLEQGIRILYTDLSMHKVLQLIDTTTGTTTPIYLGYIYGIPDWSPNGEYFIIGCMDPGKFCLYKSNELPTFTYPIQKRPLPKPFKEINLPNECMEMIGDRTSLLFRDNNDVVKSISWSTDNERLAFVCKDFHTSKSFVCVLSINSSGSCLPKNKLFNEDIDIYKIKWIPDKEEFLITVMNNKSNLISIIRTSLAGNPLSQINNGWSPDVFPDGKHIIYFCLEDENRYADICINDLEGKNKAILYTSPLPSLTDNLDYYYTTFSCSEITILCRLSISRSGKEVYFDGNIGEDYNTSIMKLDLNSGKISLLARGGILSNPSVNQKLE